MIIEQSLTEISRCTVSVLIWKPRSWLSKKLKVKRISKKVVIVDDNDDEFGDHVTEVRWWWLKKIF